MRNPTSGYDGGDVGAVSIRRAVNWRRSFAIRGIMDGAEDDIFYANTTSDGTDGVMYKGYTDFDYNVINRKAMVEYTEEYVANTVSSASLLYNSALIYTREVMIHPQLVTSNQILRQTLAN